MHLERIVNPIPLFLSSSSMPTSSLRKRICFKISPQSITHKFKTVLKEELSFLVPRKDFLLHHYLTRKLNNVQVEMFHLYWRYLS